MSEYLMSGGIFYCSKSEVAPPALLFCYILLYLSESGNVFILAETAYSKYLSSLQSFLQISLWRHISSELEEQFCIYDLSNKKWIREWIKMFWWFVILIFNIYLASCSRILMPVENLTKLFLVQREDPNLIDTVIIWQRSYRYKILIS